MGKRGADKKEKQESKNEITAEMEDIRAVMSTPGGRRYMFKLLERSGLNRVSFTGQSNSTIFNEGGRNQGLQLKSDLRQAAPGSYATMMKENDDG